MACRGGAALPALARGKIQKSLEPIRVWTHRDVGRAAFEATAAKRV